MAQEFVVVSICDGCKVYDGIRNTENVDTHGIPGTQLEIELCGGCREALDMFFVLLQKQGRVPGKRDAARPKAPAVKVVPSKPVQQAIPAGPLVDISAQDWDVVPVPEDKICRVPDAEGRECGFDAETSQGFGAHRTANHPETLKPCVACGERTGNPYNHYRRNHPEYEAPPGAWRYAKLAVAGAIQE